MEYPELNHFECRTVKYTEIAQRAHLGTTVEEPKYGKIELWVCLASPDCSGPNTLIFSSVVRALHGPALLRELAQQSTRLPLFADEMKLMWSSLFLVFWGRTHNIPLNYFYQSQKRGMAWHTSFSINSCCPTFVAYFCPLMLNQILHHLPVTGIMLSNN